MFKVYYIVENYWGNEKEELNEKFNNMEDVLKKCNEEFDEYYEWWVEDEEGNEMYYHEGY